MNLIHKTACLLALSAFSMQTLFAIDVHQDPVLIPKEDTSGEKHLQKKKGEELLDEQIAPPPPPALIDLQSKDKPKPKTFKDRYSGLALLLFNTLMFVGGMVVVKTMPGKNVEEA